MSILNAGPTDLLKKLDPAAATTRASYSRQRRPWSAGYNAIATAPGAAAQVWGVDSADYNDTTQVIVLYGQGRAANATPWTYTMPAGSPALPTSNAAAIVDASLYLNAVFLAYAPGDRENAVLLERLGTGGANVTRQFIRADSATVLAIGFTYAAGPLYGDLPKGWILEIQIPTAGRITNLWTAAADDTTVLQVKDFMAAGFTGALGRVNLNRVYR